MQNSADFVIEADIFNNSNMDFSEVNLKLIEGNLNTKVNSLVLLALTDNRD